MITVKQVKKSFALAKKDAKKANATQVLAVQDVSFSCQAGEVLALLGSNGAGKTTTLRLLSTALEPDAGEIWINDIPVHQYPRPARQSIGFISNGTPLYRRLTVRENLAFFGALYQLEGAALTQRIEQLAVELKFAHYLDQKVDQLSTGMTQKASIARSIMHDPELLILDEPTTGLDVEAAQHILYFIGKQKAAGKAVVFSTHHMNEVELLADHLCLIDQGRNCFNGSVTDAKQQTGHSNMTQTFLALIGKELL